MKKLLFVSALALGMAFLYSPASANDAHHPAEAPASDTVTPEAPVAPKSGAPAMMPGMEGMPMMEEMEMPCMEHMHGMMEKHGPDKDAGEPHQHAPAE